MCYKNEIKVIRVEKGEEKATVKMAVAALKLGKIVVCPTDTIYGFLADATNEKAIDKIFKIKKRPAKKVFPVFVKDLKMADGLAEINQKQEEFLKKYWPGKITVVLKRKGRLKLYGVYKETIALRIPKHQLLQLIINQLNRPIVQTSVNLSGQPPINNPREILRQFSYKKYAPEVVLDSGPIKNGIQSTLVDLTKDNIKILREGAVSIRINQRWPRKNL